MLLMTDGLGQAFGLGGGSRLLDVLQGLADHYGDAGAALLALRTYLGGGSLAASAQAAMGAAIAQAASSDAELRALLDGPLGAFLLDQQAGTPPSVVLRTLAAVTTPLHYALEKTARPAALQTGDAHLSFGGNADASATLSVATPADAGLDVPSGDALLQFQLGAELDLQGAYKLPFNGGSLGSSASTATAVSLTALFQWPAGSSVVGALAHSVSHLCAPWDLDEVDAQLAPLPSQGGVRGLRELRLSTDGSVQWSGSLGVGRTWAYDDRGFSAVSDLSASLDMDLGVDVGLSRQGHFVFRVQRSAAGGIAVTVQRNAASGVSADASLTAGLSVSGLGQAVQPIVDRSFPDPSPLLAALRTWSAPGTRLVAALQARLPSNDPALRLLGQYLLGTTDAADAEAQLRQLIGSAVSAAVDSRVPFWSQIAQPQTLATQIATQVGKRFGLETNVAAALVQALAPPLAQAIGEVDTAFQHAVVELAATAGNALGALLAPFATIGEDVQALARAVDAEATAIVAPALRLLAAYDQVRSQVLAAVTAAYQIKLGLGLKAQYQRQRSDAAEFGLRIVRITARTRLLYRALMLGRMDTVWGLLDAAVAAGDADAPSGVFATTITRQRQIDLSVYFGKTTLSWTQASGTSVEVSVDANGMLGVGSQARFSLQSAATAFGASDSASFGGTLDIATALQDPGRALPVTFAFALDFSDARMTKAELQRYLASLMQRAGGVPLLDPAAVSAALARYDEPGAAARLDTAVSLDSDALARLVALTQNAEGVQRLLSVARAALFAAGLGSEQRDVLAAIAPQPTAAGVAQLLAQIEREHRDAEWISEQFTARTGDALPTTGGIASAAGRVYTDAVHINLTARGLLDALTALYEAPARLAAAVPPSPKPAPAALSALYAQALDATNRRVVQGLQGWFVAANWYDQAPASTVALLATLAQLGGAPAPLLVPLLQYSEGGVPKVLAF